MLRRKDKIQQRMIDLLLWASPWEQSDHLGFFVLHRREPDIWLIISVSEWRQ